MAIGLINGNFVTTGSISAGTTITRSSNWGVVTEVAGDYTAEDGNASTIYTYAIPSDCMVSIEVEAVANEASSGNRNTYKIHGTFSRNGSGSAAQIGDLVSINTNEVATAWNCTLAASGNNVIVQQTSASSIYWIYNVRVVQN